MNAYSYSRLNRFHECPAAFKFGYLDKVKEMAVQLR